MKSFIGAVVAFVVVMFGIQIYTSALSRCTDTLEYYTEEIIVSADRLDWQACQNNFQEFLNHWNKAKKWFSVFIHHEEMDLINQALYEIEMYLRYEKQAETAAKANVLKILLEHIPENERLTLENLL